MSKILKNTAILTAITLVAGVLLGMVYDITKEPIAAAQEEKTQEAYAEVLAEADSFREYDGFDADNPVTIDNVDVTEVVVGEGDGVVGYVISVTTHDGYGGDIELAVGIDATGVVKGLSILEINETAGLGMNAEKADFREQYVDKEVDAFTVVKGEAGADDEISAISSATITSTAVTNAVNAALEYYQTELGGGGQ